ncbi:MAG TPA: protein kinase [Polyangiaceae bacterium]|nr:protein kinase [Polyangiaceae bacterium]
MPEPERRCAKCGAAYGGEVLFCPADGTPLASRPVGAELERFVGQTLRGEFALEALGGVGAMASVFRARQLGVERDVAVKIMHRELTRNPVLVARFRREARAAARIRHPNVVEVVGSGDMADGAESLPYLVFEYLDGFTLRSALSAAGGTLPLARALHIVLQMSDAVGEAHEAGIIHRDLKPENAMLVRRGDDPDFVKLLDFGLSRLGEGDAGIETHAGAVLGTARYVSPEGARGEPVDRAADVYALATILFECLAGRTPFDGDRPVALLVKKSNERAPDVRHFERARATPEPIAALLAASLALEPAARPADGRAFGQALAHAAAQSGVGADQLLPRPTLLGTRSSARLPHAETRVLGSPAFAASLAVAVAQATNTASPPSPPNTANAPNTPNAPNAPNGVASPSVIARREPPAPELRRVGIVAACFVLGALGALGAATHLGACGR